MLDLNPKFGVTKTNTITLGGSKHAHIRSMCDVAVLLHLQRSRLRHMAKPFLYESRNDSLRTRGIERTRCEIVPSGSYPCARCRDKCNGFHIARLEADCGAGGNVESHAVCAAAVK
jgi:hypothetical protein